MAMIFARTWVHVPPMSSKVFSCNSVSPLINQTLMLISVSRAPTIYLKTYQGHMLKQTKIHEKNSTRKMRCDRRRMTTTMNRESVLDRNNELNSENNSKQQVAAMKSSLAPLTRVECRVVEGVAGSLMWGTRASCLAASTSANLKLSWPLHKSLDWNKSRWEVGHSFNSPKHELTIVLRLKRELYKKIYRLWISD